MGIEIVTGNKSFQITHQSGKIKRILRYELKTKIFTFQVQDRIVDLLEYATNGGDYLSEWRFPSRLNEEIGKLTTAALRDKDVNELLLHLDPSGFLFQAKAFKRSYHGNRSNKKDLLYTLGAPFVYPALEKLFNDGHDLRAVEKHTDVLRKIGEQPLSDFFGQWLYRKIKKDQLGTKFLFEFGSIVKEFQQTIGITHAERLISTILQHNSRNRMNEINMYELRTINEQFNVLIQTQNYDAARLIEYVFENCYWRQGFALPRKALEQIIDWNIMCQKLGWPIRNKYPDSIRKEHDVATLHFNLQKDDIRNREFQERVSAADYQALQWKGKEYSIVIPTSCEELTREGKILSHCVGSYADRIIDMEKYYIVFLRKNNALDQPYITVELREETIHQARGQSNSEASKSDYAVLEEWLSSLKAKQKIAI